mmetsp:Transcript_21559/g.38933  ORF Transcript_21559/g.38933 Transcript_21559/m.38933 type:complete len:360 (+) Transcript_21559:71-1150(+)
MAFPTKLRCCMTKGDADGDRASTRQAPAPAGKLVNLSVEQAKGLNFPIGCPVWYNFSQLEGVVDIREGVVHSINLDILSKTLVFMLKKNVPDGLSSIDTVLEDDIAYAANCPVVVSSTGAKPSNNLDGEIIFARPVKGANGNEMSYIVRYSARTNHVRIEEGVNAGRLKYRETEAMSKQQRHGGKREVKFPAISSTVSEEEHSKEPSEIVIVEDGVSKNRCKKPRSIQKKLKLEKKRRKDEDPSLRGLAKVKAGMHQPKDDRIKVTQYEGYHELPKVQRREISKNHERIPGKKHVISDKDQEYVQEDPSDYQDKDYRDAGIGGVCRKSCKRKAEMTKKVSEKRVCWEPPHSSYENDGAI